MSEARAPQAPSQLVDGIDHVGASVADLDAALRFWEAFPDAPAHRRGTLERPYVVEHVGVPGIRIEAAFVDLPDGAVLELLDYQTDDRTPNQDATANPGNVHSACAWPKVSGRSRTPSRPGPGRSARRGR